MWALPPHKHEGLWSWNARDVQIYGQLPPPLVWYSPPLALTLSAFDKDWMGCNVRANKTILHTLLHWGGPGLCWIPLVATIWQVLQLIAANGHAYIGFFFSASADIMTPFNSLTTIRVLAKTKNSHLIAYLCRNKYKKKRHKHNYNTNIPIMVSFCPP